MYYLTGVQHSKKDGDVIIQTQDFSTFEAAKYKFNEEWNYTYASDDRIGLDTIIFDGQGNIVLNDHYVKINESNQEAKSEDKNPKTE